MTGERLFDLVNALLDAVAYDGRDLSEVPLTMEQVQYVQHRFQRITSEAVADLHEAAVAAHTEATR